MTGAIFTPRTPLHVAIPTVDELTMSAARLLQESLAQAVQAADPANVSPRDLELARSNSAVQAFVMASGLHGCYRYLRDFIARQAIPVKSTGEFLDGWLETYGLPRKAASFAMGRASGTGLAGAALLAGSLFAADDGREYVVVGSVVVANDGTVVVELISVAPGLAQNISGGGKLSLVSAIDGINTTFVVDANGLQRGADVESDAEAIFRLQQRLAYEPLGGAPADYARWAMSVEGITRAWGIRNPNGPCTAGVVCLADNTADGLPTSSQIDAVYDYITDPDRGPPDELYVFAPTLLRKDFTIRLTPDTPEIRAAVTAELKNLFWRESQPAGSMPHSHVVEAISIAAGEFTHTIIAPAIEQGGFFTTASWREMLALGAISYV